MFTIFIPSPRTALGLLSPLRSGVSNSSANGEKTLSAITQPPQVDLEGQSQLIYLCKRAKPIKDEAGHRRNHCHEAG
jgi:hypothetical protein